MSQTNLTFRQIVDNETPSMHGPDPWQMKDSNDRIQCNDGESLSIQASQYTHCTPQTDAGPYLALEVGFPSVTPPDSMMEFCDDPSKPTDTVYGYVPVKVIQEFIDLHDGEKVVQMVAEVTP